MLITGLESSMPTVDKSKEDWTSDKRTLLVVADDTVYKDGGFSPCMVVEDTDEHGTPSNLGGPRSRW